MNWFTPQKKKRAQMREAHDLENQDGKVRVQGMVQLKDSICLQMSPNCFLGIWTLSVHSRS